MSQVVSFIDYTPAPRFDGIPWTHVVVEEGTSNSGPWTTIDTIALSPVDADPSQPQTRNITIENASDTVGLWYRLTFTDNNGSTGLPSTPIQNTESAGSFATADEFADRIGFSLSTAELDRAAKLLTRATTEIQKEARQHIFQVTDDVFTMRGTVDRRILLPERPVQTVSTVNLAGVDLIDGTDWFQDGDEIVRKIFTFLAVDALDAWTFGRGFGYEWQTLSITYTHGYADTDIPGFLKEIACEAVTRVWFNPQSVARTHVGDTQTVFDNMRFSPSGLKLTADEKMEIRRFFGNRGGSVAMRD